MSSGGFWKPGVGQSVRQSSVLVDDSGGGGPSESAAVPFNFSTSPLAQQRLQLPISKHRRQILYAIERFKILVIVGETGSGKSTQIPQYLYENGWADNGFQIVCTQPRRIAAQTLASRVSSELGSPLGRTVGYTVRFDDASSPRETRIKYVTDGMLLREATLSDPLLSKYSVVMIDEAHERNLNGDSLLGVVKKIRKRRSDLRVVVCSATIDARAFLEFFVGKKRKGKGEGAPTSTATGGIGDGRKRRRRWGRVGESAEEAEARQRRDDDEEEEGTIISIDGRQHPVDVLYSRSPVADYVKATVETALGIHAAEDESSGGDVLCFLPSGEDVDRAVQMAEDVEAQTMTAAPGRSLAFLPLYGTLPYQMQARVFQPKSISDRSVRRIIFATNIAETSVTVPDVSHVVDSGFAKLPYFDPKTGFDRLIVSPVSRASARQRAGRAGRVRPGKCYRLYTENFMAEKMRDATPPEVLRSNLAGFVLTLKALGVRNVLAFDLMDAPTVESLSHALECLYALGAIDDRTELTDRGLDMSAFPTEPRVSRMLLESLGERCSGEVLSVAAALQVRSLFHRPRTERQRVDFDVAQGDLVDRTGDHVTYVNLLQMQQDAPMDEEECKERFVNALALKRAVEVRSQLGRFLRRYGTVRSLDPDVEELERSRSIRRCVTAGFFFNVAKLGNDGRYYTLRGKHLVVPAPSSVLHKYGEGSEYMLFGETYDGSRGGIEVRHCSAIEGRWLRELAPHYWE